MKKFIKPLLLCACAGLITSCGELKIKFLKPTNEVPLEEFTDTIWEYVNDYKLAYMLSDDEPYAYVAQATMTSKDTYDGVTTEGHQEVKLNFDLKHNVFYGKKQTIATGEEDIDIEIYSTFANNTVTDWNVKNKTYINYNDVTEREYQVATNESLSDLFYEYLTNTLMIVAFTSYEIKTYVDDMMCTAIIDYHEGDKDIDLKYQVVFGEKEYTLMMDTTERIGENCGTLKALMKVEFKNKTVKAPKANGYNEENN